MARFGKKCTYDNFNFDSEAERDFYIYIKSIKTKGGIKDFIMQVTYPLQEEFTTNFDHSWTNVKIQPIVFSPDYLITLNDDSQILVDTKGSSGCIEVDSQLRRKMLLYRNPTIPIIFIAKLPIYLGSKWVEITAGSDFQAKLRLKYGKLYPSSKGNKSKPINWKIDNWKEYFNFHEVSGMFYVWDNTITIKKTKVKKVSE